MNLKDIISIDNNEYLVISKVLFENKTYYYLINMEGKKTVITDDDKNEVTDENLIHVLLPMFFEVAANYIKEKRGE